MAEQDSDPSLEVRIAASSARKVSSIPEHLVRWEQVAKVAEALFATADADPDVVRRALTGLLEYLTMPHRLLEQLDVHVDGVLSGDSTASAELVYRLSTFAESDPCLIGSIERIQAKLERSGNRRARMN